MTQSSLSSLPTKVAIVLILMMIVGSLGGTILFTYKVGIEAKDAFVTLKTHVRYSNYAESLGLNKWMEENNVTQQVDSYMNQAYDTLFQQVSFKLSHTYPKRNTCAVFPIIVRAG